MILYHVVYVYAGIVDSIDTFTKVSKAESCFIDTIKNNFPDILIEELDQAFKERCYSSHSDIDIFIIEGELIK